MLGQPEQHPLAARIRRSLDYIGANGLWVRSWSYNGERLLVVVDSLDVRRLNPCFQGLIWASHLLPEVEEFAVATSGSGDAIMRVSSTTLELNMRVWRYARDQYVEMPPCTFLPSDYESRLQYESTHEAVFAIATLALNEMSNSAEATLETGSDREVDTEQFDVDIRLIRLALEACEELIADPPKPFTDALDIASALTETTTASARRPLVLRVDQYYDQLDYPSVSPSVEAATADY